MKRILTILSMTLFAGCAPQHSGSPGVTILASNQAASPESLQAFQTTVYAFGQTQGCVQCHSGNVNPQWMNPAIATAYAFARPLININDPTNSIFATYVANGHCNNPICEDAANIPIMQDLLSQWATVEINQVTSTQPDTSTLPLANPPYVTATMPIPSNLPLLTSGAPVVIRFDLSQLTPPVAALTGAILEVSIESYNVDLTTYKVFNPRLAGNSQAVSISGIHVYVRPSTGTGLGTEDLNQGLQWSEISVVSPATALPSPLPTGPMTSVAPLINTSLGIAVQSSADMITIGFAGIQ